MTVEFELEAMYLHIPFILSYGLELFASPKLAVSGSRSFIKHTFNRVFPVPTNSVFKHTSHGT